jgi:putative membrane protein
MNVLAKILVGAIALLHLGVLTLEMFLWSTPLVQDKVKDFDPRELAAILAANQGLYNGFLAAGLVWGLLDKQKSFSIWVFFLSCIAIAGIYGSLTLGRPTAVLVQTIPALIALLLLFFTRKP